MAVKQYTTSDAQWAATMVGTKSLPPGLAAVRDLAAQARAYQAQRPYPQYYFRGWKTEDRGPLPLCLPIAKSIVERGAKWLLGQPVQLTCPGNPTLETALRDAWRDNNMDRRGKAFARRCGVESGAALKFSYDPARTPAIRFQTLSLIDEVRFFYHPHDRTLLLMARVQYSFLDPSDGLTYWYREEWTADKEIHYNPVKASDIGTFGSADTYDGWVQSTRQNNPFGVIPVVPVKNLETDDQWGAGDLWHPGEGDGLYRVLDRVNLTYYIMDRSNQFDGQLNPIYIDLELDAADVDRPLQPGEAIDAKSAQGEHPGRVVFAPSGNSLRPHMMEFARELVKSVRDAASSVTVDQAEFTNKGNLTSAVLEQLYLPQIEITQEKRKSVGGGIEEFLSLCGRGLQNNGVALGITSDPATSQVTLKWPDFFPLSQDERAAVTTRTDEQVQGGYLTRPRAIARIALAEGIDDVEALEKELADWTPPAPEVPNANAQNAQTAQKGLEHEGGDEAK